MRCYLAGPMRGIPEYNAPAFREATELLRSAGHEVWSPVENDEKTAGGMDGANLDLRGTFRRDLDALLQQDAVVLLDGWSRSHGACLERHCADVVGLPVFIFTPQVPGLLIPLSGHDWRWRAK